MDKFTLRKFSKKSAAKEQKVQKPLADSSTKGRRSRILYSLVACAVPVFAFLLTSVYSDSKNQVADQRSKQRASISNPFDTGVVDNELSFVDPNSPAPKKIAKQEPALNAAAPKPEQESLNNDISENEIKSNENQSELAANSEEQSEGSEQAKVNDIDELTTVLNVTDADIEALIKTFSKLTGRNYIVDSAVKGKITVHLPTAIKISEALRVFDSILLLKGFATVPVGENIWKVIVAKDAKQTTIPLAGAGNTTDESLVTEIIKSTHIGSEEIQKLVSQFISKDGYSQAISGTNLLIIVDAASNITRIKTLIKEIDIPPVDQDITIIPISHAIATDVAEKINAILSKEDSKAEATNVNQFNLPFRRPGNLNSSQLNNNSQQDAIGGARPSYLKIIPDERTNSLIVVADEFTTLKIRALAEQLDSEVDKSSGRFWVYRLEHANAEELSEVLGNLISGTGGSPTSTNSSGSSISRSSNNNSGLNGQGGSQFGGSNAGGSSSGRRSSINRQKQNSSGAPGVITSDSKVAFEDEISVAADPSTNSLIINAGKTDYEKLSQVIRELDVKRRQVLVEATILEVSLNDTESLGLELQGTAATTDAGFITQTNFGGLTNLLANPAALSDLTIAAASAGSLTLPGGLEIPSQAVLLSAVSQHSNVNVLSAPTILSTDNQEAEIIVGENVPFVASTSTNQTNLGNTFNQIQRQDVGITLKITPQLGTGDFLTLQIFVEISNVVDSTRNNANGPTTTVRTTDTVVAVKNRQMIVTGGLIQDSANDSTRGIPFLEDVPLLGNLFRKDSSSKRRTNLLIFLTPQIIQDQFDSREQSKIKAEELSEIIDRAKAYPSREEILKNPALDEVLESGEEINIKDNLPLPTTQETVQPLRKSLTVAKANSDGVYEFTVLDKKQEKKKTSTSSSNGNYYAVFKSLNGNPSSLKSNSDNTIGIVFPRTEKSAKTFAAGAQYRVNGKDLICLGVYLEAKEAEAMHAELLTWNEEEISLKSEFQKLGWEFSE